jgi:dTDP-4-dehydrorhamnose reductase
LWPRRKTTVTALNVGARVRAGAGCGERGATLVTARTVFDGDTERPYVEADRPNPQRVAVV